MPYMNYVYSKYVFLKLIILEKSTKQRVSVVLTSEVNNHATNMAKEAGPRSLSVLCHNYERLRPRSIIPRVEGVFSKLSSANRVFSLEAAAAILVSQRSETARMIVYQATHMGAELFFYENTSFCSSKLVCVLCKHFLLS